MTDVKLRAALLPLPLIVLAGATAPSQPAKQPVTAVASASPLSKPHYLDVAPFHDGLGTVANEANTYSWTAIGGIGSTSDRRKRLLGALASAGASGRQKARFDYARFLVISGRAIEGSAVLDAMAEDEPELATNAAFQTVRAIARIRAGRFKEGLEVLDLPALVSDSDACLWRSYAHANSDNPQAAILNWPCAINAVNRKDTHERQVFATAIFRSAYITGNDALAAHILPHLSGKQPEVAFWSGMFAIRHGENELGTKLLTEARDSGHTPLSSRAELELVNAQQRIGAITTKTAVERLDKLRFEWRGGPLERDLLMSLSRYQEKLGNLRSAIAASAPLIRYFDLGSQTPAEIARGQRLIQAAFNPASGLSLSDQAGIYWDYRDLAPQGAEGDELIRKLAEKLAVAGLQRRAADLLERQIQSRLTDSAPAVAIRVAEWRLLAGQPDKALQILQDTNDGVIAPDVRQLRQLLFVCSLLSLNRGAEAMALLDGDSAGLSRVVRAELYWQGREWTKFMAVNRELIDEQPNTLGNDARAMIVRQAIAASIAHDQAELERLGNRYREQFVAKDSYLGPAFQLLTGGAAIDPTTMKQAMADIDKASPTDPALAWVNALTQTAG